MEVFADDHIDGRQVAFGTKSEAGGQIWRDEFQNIRTNGGRANGRFRHRFRDGGLVAAIDAADGTNGIIL